MILHFFVAGVGCGADGVTVGGRRGADDKAIHFADLLIVCMKMNNQLIGANFS